MAETPSRAEPAARAGLAARCLGLGRGLDYASQGLVLLALATLLWFEAPHSIPLALSVAAGLAQKFFALRVDLDRGIFEDWARRWESSDAPPAETDLAAFDAALSALVSGREAGPVPRPLDDRIRGALGLLKRQSAAFILQVAALLAAALPL